MVPTETDYMVVGGGSGGCAAAGMLAERSGGHVTLVESGGTNARDDVVRPFRWPDLLSSDANWAYETVPQRSALDRVHVWPMGKILGGSSSVNGMIYMRGAPWDYDRWVELGNPGWDAETVYAIFRKMEDDPSNEQSVLGHGGPLSLTRVSGEHPLTAAFLAACEERGYSRTKDFNGLDPEGFGTYALNMEPGRRHDAGFAFLGTAAEHPNLTVLTDTTATRLTFGKSQERVEGVVVLRDGEQHWVRVNREVLVCGGAIASPQLLMLSGIGPVAELEKLGIPLTVALDGVGRNLHDHISIRVAYQAKKPLPKTEYQLVEAGIYVRSEPDSPHYDIHIPIQQFTFFAPDAPADGTGYAFSAGTLKPVSRGTVRLRSADPRQPPLVDPAYLSENEDLEKLAFALGVARDIGSAPAFAEWRDREISPGPECCEPGAIREFIRSAAGTAFHPVGTCRMGLDADAVVDSRLKVYGVANLRIADASVMPEVVSAPTNGASMMLGWRGGEFAAEDAGKEV